MAVLFVLSQVIQPVGPWYVLRMIFAVAGLLIVPGYVFAKCALREKIDLFLFLVPVFGFLFQLGIILVIYAAEPLLTSSGLTFPDMFISLSFVALCGLAFVGHFTFESEISGRRLLKQSLPILILLFVGVVPRLVLMGDTSTPATDGALYLSQARNAVLTGNFNAIVANDSPVISNWTTLGL